MNAFNAFTMLIWICQTRLIPDFELDFTFFFLCFYLYFYVFIQRQLITYRTKELVPIWVDLGGFIGNYFILFPLFSLVLHSKCLLSDT